MKYFIIVNGETCTLPARTLEMDERIDMIRGLDRMNKAGEISEDDQKDLETKVQKMTDKYIADIDKAVDEKSKEILTV